MEGKGIHCSDIRYSKQVDEGQQQVNKTVHGDRQVGQRTGCRSRTTQEQQNKAIPQTVCKTCNESCTRPNTLYEIVVKMHPPSAENIIPQIMQKHLPGPLAPNSCTNRFNKKTLACRLYIRNLSGVILAFGNCTFIKLNGKKIGSQTVGVLPGMGKLLEQNFSRASG